MVFSNCPDTVLMIDAKGTTTGGQGGGEERDAASSCYSCSDSTPRPA